MIRFLTVLILCAVSASSAFATPVDLIVTGGSLDNRLNTSLSSSHSVPPSMPSFGGTGIVHGSANSSANYLFTNAGGVASFDISQIAQTIVFDNNVSVDAIISGTIDFQLNETVDYVLTGAYSASSTGASTGVGSSVELTDLGSLDVIYMEEEYGHAPANYIINGLNDSNFLFFVTNPGNQAGTLVPGNYRLKYYLEIEDGGSDLFTANATGNVNLTFTSIPEPSSATLLLGMGLIIGACLSRKSSRYALLLFLTLFGFGSISAQAQFSTTISIPPQPNIGDSQSIGAGTQLNIMDGGSVGSGFDATGPNTEVNILGGSIGHGFDALAGTAVNISGGEVGGGFRALSGSVVNMTGGRIDAASAHKIVQGGTMFMSGGIIEQSLSVILSGSLTVSGGRFSRVARADTGSSLVFEGGDFHLNGSPIPGLSNPGDMVQINPAENSVFSGVLEDGIPFSIFVQPNFIDAGTLTLKQATLPAIGPALITASTDAIPTGIRSGQTLVVDAGSFVPEYFRAGRGSQIEVTGGTIDDHLQMTAATMEMTAGHISNSTDLIDGSIANISGGTISRIDAWNRSEINLSGGEVGLLIAYFASLDMTGGIVDRIIAFGHVDQESTNRISGGTVVEQVHISGDGGFLEISGGTFNGSVAISEQGTLNLLGSSFAIDGTPIVGLLPGEPFEITDRNAVLTATLADGSPFSFDLIPGGSQYNGPDSIADDGSKLLITLVPEPTTLALAVISIVGFSYRRRR